MAAELDFTRYDTPRILMLAEEFVGAFSNRGVLTNGNFLLSTEVFKIYLKLTFAILWWCDKIYTNVIT